VPEEPEEGRILWPEHEMWPQGGYANVIAANFTPWDFTIRFGLVTLPPVGPGVSGPVEIPATPVAQVTLAPVAAAQVAAVLQDQIAKYTAIHGPIGGSPEQGIG
jgi:hypothetical protein